MEREREREGEREGEGEGEREIQTDRDTERDTHAFKALPDTLKSNKSTTCNNCGNNRTIADQPRSSWGRHADRQGY